MKIHPEELAPDTWIKDNIFKKEVYKFFNKNKTVLDCGCGTGFFTERFGEISKLSVGVDIADSNIKIAKMLSKNGKFIKADIQKLPFKDGKFDIVTAIEVIDHLNDREKGLEEIRRVLKKGGILIISLTTHPRNIISRFFFYLCGFTAIFFYDENNPETHKIDYNIKEIKKLIKYLESKKFIILKERKYKGVIPTILIGTFIFFDGFSRFFTKKEISNIGDNYYRLNSPLIKFYIKFILPIVKILCKITTTDFDNAGYLIIAKLNTK